MISRDKIASLMAQRVELFEYADGVIATISNGHYSYSMPLRDAPTVQDKVTGRPAKMFRRQQSMPELVECGLVEEMENQQYRPVRWMDDVWLGVCRLTEQTTGKIDVVPSILWALYTGDAAATGFTAGWLVERRGIAERTARRYVGKLITLDSIVTGGIREQTRSSKN